MKTTGLRLLISIHLFLSALACGQSTHVNFNFENVELQNLVSIVGAHTGKRFVLDTALTGRVSVITREQIPQEEVFPLFLSVLESSGFTVVERDGSFLIRDLPDEDPLQAPVVGADEPLRNTGLVTRVIKLNHIRAYDVRPMLEPMVRRSRSGSLQAFGPTNHLIITDTASNIARIEELLAELDQPGLSNTIQIIPLSYAEASELASQISKALAGAESANDQARRAMSKVVSGAGSLPSSFSIVAAKQANALIVAAGPVQMQEVERMVGLLDVPRGGAARHGRLHAVFLNYLNAETAAKQLTELFSKRSADEGGRVGIEADLSNNALLVDAASDDFATIEELLKTLDRPPQQVLVEVMIVEIAETGTLDLGVEWATVDSPGDGETTFVGRSRPGEVDGIMDLITQRTFPQGMSFGIARGVVEAPDGTLIPRVPFLLQAMAGDRDVNILSNVPLRAQNNSEAEVSVVENIPVLRSVIQGGTGDNRDVIQNIDRLDVGIKLSVTPQVNPNREITLELNPAIETVIDESVGDTQLTPTIARREVKSTITVPEKATVVISGLLQETSVEEESRVPILGRIPIIGALFRSTSERKQKTNLLIFVTPYLVTDVASDADASERWQKKTGISSEPETAEN